MAALPSSSSRSLRSSSKRTRSPLQELSLDQFLVPPTMSNSSRLATCTKRPVSPGTPVLYSPAKRRILNEEGLFTAKTPLSSTVTATPSSSKQSIRAPQNYCQQSATRFADALMGPDSPARKLDFGTPKNAVGSKTPLRRSAEDKLASSPEIKARTQSRFGNREADKDDFSISSQSRTQPYQAEPQSRSRSQAALSFSSLSSSSQPHHHPQFVSTPRELPPPPDPQSEHYPGFTVYQDRHTLIPALRLTSPATSSPALTPLDDNSNGDFEIGLIDSRELVKENLPPRRKTHKGVTASAAEKEYLMSPPSAKSPPMLATPPREFSSREKETLTPRHLSIFGVSADSELGRTQHTPSKEDWYGMRRILEEEVDGEQGDD